MLTLKKVKEMVKAPAHTKRVPSPKVLLEEGRIFLRKEFEHGSHLTLYHSGYAPIWLSEKIGAQKIKRYTDARKMTERLFHKAGLWYTGATGRA